jgi:hypothetical protein
MPLRANKKQSAIEQMLRDDFHRCTGKISLSQILLLCGALSLFTVGGHSQEIAKQNLDTRQSAASTVPSGEKGAIRTANSSAWLPAGIDQAIPPVDVNSACPLPELLKGTTQQMIQFVNNLERFTAMERVEHFEVSSSLRLAKPEVRNFQYVVTIQRNPGGSFILDEFRNGSDDRSQLPANTATEGLPAMALLFHPMLVNDFNFVCEGMGQWHERPAWQVHYIQKPGKASRLRAYVTSKEVVHVALKGRVWIDPASFQVLRLESELVEPVKEIELLNDRSTIEYMPVQFQSQKEQLWLPSVAEIYVQRRDRRYYRRLTFSDFRLFNVEIR